MDSQESTSFFMAGSWINHWRDQKCHSPMIYCMFIYFPLFSLFIFSISNCLLLESDKSIEFHDSKNVESCAVGVPHWIVSSCFAQPLGEVLSLSLSLYMYIQNTGSEEQAHKNIMILYTVYIYMTYHQLSPNLR